MKHLRTLIVSLTLTLAFLGSARPNVPTVFGDALSFNGTNQYVSVTNFGKIIPTNEVTVEFWAYTTQVAGQSAFMLSPDYGTNRFNAHINYANGGAFGNTYWDFGNISGGGRLGPIPAPANSTSNWIHYAFAASRSSNYMRIYTNGNLLAGKTGMNPFVRGNYELRIGGGGANYFNYNGRLDEFRVWSTARSQAQIQANLSAPLVGNEAGLLLYYRFNSANGMVATNSAIATGAAYNGKLMNGPAWVNSDAPAHVVVSNVSDSGPGSLRQAIADAINGYTIVFATNLSGKTIALTNGELVLNKSLTIDASALPAGIAINGSGKSRIFEIAGDATVSLVSLTVTGGGNADPGGAIYSNPGTTLTLLNCTLTGNRSVEGGAILNDGKLTLMQCTLSGNIAPGGYGGALQCRAPAVLNQCTLSGNSADFGGGVYNKFTTLTLNNSIVGGNTGPDISSQGAVVVYTNANLVTSIQLLDNTSSVSGMAPLTGSPHLAPLGNYGGPTQTMPPLPGSPAIDGCANGTSFTTDQRGLPRLAGPAPDIGAVEAQIIPVVLTSADSGYGSLRYAITYNPLGSTLTFTSTLSGATITLTSGELVLNQSFTIDASPLAGGLTINGGGRSSIFDIAGSATVSLVSLTLTNGNAGSGPGGAIYGNAGSTLTLWDCTLTGNNAQYGGAIFTKGKLTLMQCTLSGNTATYGGALYCWGPAILNQCTLSGNSASSGGGVYNWYTTLTLNNSIVGGNTSPDISSQGAAVVYTNANLVTSIQLDNTSSVSGIPPLTGSPQLAPLGNYGGPTPTMPPLSPASPAIDACTKGTAFKTDQRGLPRVIGPFADLGAVEVQALSAASPTLTLNAPTSGQLWSNSVFTASGTSHDKVAVTQVLYSLNGAAWLAATPSNNNNWTNWTAPLSLVPGTNTFAVFAIDTGGNISALKTVKFLYVVMEPLTVRTNGVGTVTPNYNGTLLQIGKTYQMTAQAGPGYLFAGWTGGLATNSPTLQFTMQSNLVLTANFIRNPFIPLAGTYQGLFYDPNGVEQASSGAFSATVSSNGVFSAKFQQGANSFPVSGQFSLTGAWQTNSIQGWTNVSARLQLRSSGVAGTTGNLGAADRTVAGNVAGPGGITGSLSNSLWTAAVGANRAVYSNSNPAPQAGKYTLVLPGSTDAAVEPGGDGYGTVNVDTNGTVTFNGTLGDGTKVVQSAFVSKTGEWAVYIPLYANQGSLLGWLAFANQAESDLAGLVNWIKPAHTLTNLYPNGFTNQTEAVGSRYASTNGLRVLNLTNGVLILEDGNLPQTLMNGFTLGTNNVAIGTNGLSLTISNSTGLFQGSVTNPATQKAIKFNGVVLQKQNAGYGTFLGPSQSGPVFLRE